MIFKSIQWRSQLGHTLLICIGGPLLLIIPYKRERELALTNADQQLAEIGATINLKELRRGNDQIEDKLPPNGWCQLLESDGDVMFATPNAPDVVASLDDHPGSEFFWVGDQRVFVIRRVRNSRVILLGLPREDVYADVRNLPFILVGFGLAFGISAIMIGLWTARNTLKPVARFSEAAKKISTSEKPELIDLEGTHDELLDLGRTLNSAFERLHLALQKQRSLTADASHELRTPISIILLELESALRKERTPEEYQERIQSSLEATQHLKNLVETLLVLARSDMGGLALDRQPTDLKSLVKEVAQLMAPKLESARSSLTLELESCIREVDDERTMQVLINLLQNTLQHTPSGTDITIRLKSEGTLTVSDDGPGIPDHAVKHIFDRFYRIDRSRNTTQGNLGLGLAICKTIIESQDGTITASNQKTGGACFTITL